MRFGYDGTGFAGWARQPGLRTVEGEIRSGLVRLGLARSLEATDLSVASRTDRGVSARGNALALTSEVPAAALLRALNGLSPEIWFTHLAEVPEGFRPRAAAERRYRYWERRADRVPEGWEPAARALSGRLDARSFGRGLPASGPTWWEVSSVAPSLEGGWLVVDVRARAFVWGMVRKLVAALREVEAGALSIPRLREAIEGRERLSLPMAEPERLVLWETRYPIAWTTERADWTARQARMFRSARIRSAAREEILHRIWEDAGRPP